MITYLEYGTIVRLPSRPGFWKILNQQKGLNNYTSYRVIKCTKTGKEFVQTNGFSVEYVHKNAEIIYVPSGKATDLSPEKASRRGVEITKMKNRINFLEAKIKSYTRELQETRKRLEQY
jgi:hypothetical protein